MDKNPVVTSSFRSGLLDAVPRLRAFAVSLSGNKERADDLVQETLVKAWANSDKFQEGTNLIAWLTTILRNEFYNQHRSKSREVEDVEGSYIGRLSVLPSQDSHMELLHFEEALSQLPDEQREALILVGASGFSYIEAAEICGCAIGTIKSRVSRARDRLAEIMDIDINHEFGPDELAKAIVEETRSP